MSQSQILKMLSQFQKIHLIIDVEIICSHMSTFIQITRWREWWK